MLVELNIRNFAIIDQLRIQFDLGMNAITGETGAGKSIIIDALGAVLGDRIGADVVRTGEASATVEAVFDISGHAPPELLPMLVDFGIDTDDGTLILSRQISASGRSTGRINGTTVTVTQLGQIGSMMIDIHGQSDHLKLLRPSTQLDSLDHFAGTTHLRAEIRERVLELSRIRESRRRLRGNEREREQRIDLLRYQIDEISGAALDAGEDERIEQERAVLINAERLVSDSSSALASLDPDEGEGAGAKLRDTLLHTQRIAEIDINAEEMVERISEVVILADELASGLRRYIDAIDMDPDRLAMLDDRLDMIRNLKRKYGATIEEIQTHLASATQELERLTDVAFNDETLAEEETRIRGELEPRLEQLTATRTASARKLESSIGGAISELGLGSAQVHIAISATPEPGESGSDAVEYLFAPNQGETLKPLAKIASGGETARLMLALKSVLAQGDQTPTLVFDEVDVGVGARSGQSVGEKLWSLSARHQVLVISHLAQIAAFADAHFMIEKDIHDGRTVSTVARLEGGTRLDELAEMIDGKPVSPESRAAAEQLMDRISLSKRTGG